MQRPGQDMMSTERLTGIKAFAALLLAEAEWLDCERAPSGCSEATLKSANNLDMDFCAEIRNYEMRLIRKALQQTDGNQSRAARILGLRTTTLNAKIKRYQLVEEKSA